MRVKTGIVGLDELIGGGFRKNTINVILGAAGTGKTIFSLQFLITGIKNGEKGIYISFDLGEKEIIETASSLGWNEVEDYIKNGDLLIKNYYAETITLLNSELVSFVESNIKGEDSRVVIDSLTPLIAPLSYESRKDVNWFFSKFRELTTTLITVEEPLNGDLSLPHVSIPIFLGDSVIYLKNVGYGEAFNRTLKIIKFRASEHAEGIFPYKILPKLGIVVEGTYKTERTPTLKELLEKKIISKESIPKWIFEKVK